MKNKDKERERERKLGIRMNELEGSILRTV